MTQKFSFNVHGNFIRDEAKILTWVVKNKPTTMTVLDNPKLASKIADLGVPYVVLRLTAPLDDNLQLRMRSFAEWWLYVKHNYTDKRLGVYWNNEPHTKLELVSQFACEGMDILAAEGHWGVFGNFSVGTPTPEQLRTVLAPMMQYLTIKYSNYHKLGLHEGYMYYPEYAVPYLSGRYRFIFDIYGRDKLQIILTEFGVDWIEDVAKRYPGESIRGWKQHVPYWEAKGVLNGQQHMLDHFRWLLDNLYFDNEILGINLYCYGNSGGWDLYNFEDAEYFIDNMEQLEMETIVTVPAKQMVIKASSSQGTNRRTGAGTNFSKSKTLLTTPVTVTELERQDGWIKYRFDDGDFWVSAEYVTVVTEGRDVTITLYDATEDEIAEVKSLISSMTRLAELFEKLQAEIV